jgi:hypothetical protein
VDASRVVVVSVKLEELTVIVIELEVLVAYVVDPPYVAVMVCVPELLNEVLSVAVPELSVPVPSDVVPS